MSTYLITVFIMSILVTYIHGYSAGAPISACDSMYPAHGVASQTSTHSYTITPSVNTYNCGDSITATLSGGTFKGFLCQARPDVNSSSTVGTLVESEGSSNTVNNCAGRASLTQSSSADKTSIQFTWTHSGESVEDIYIVCTIVQNRTVFWEKVISSAVTYSGSLTTCQGSGAIQIMSSVILIYICTVLSVMKAIM